MPGALSIPLLDLEPWFTRDDGRVPAVLREEVRRACEETGFFVVTGHGVPSSLRNDAFSAAERFFALPEADKRAVSPRPWNPQSVNVYRGYFPAATDGKEGFDLGDPRLAGSPLRDPRSPFHEPNHFPPALDADWIATIEACFDAMSALGQRLVELIVGAIGGAPERVAEAFPRPGSASTLRFNRYPHRSTPYCVDPDGTPLCCASHVDNGILTVLAQDAHAGLQVCDRQGRWHDVPYAQDAYVVNTGFAFQRLTGDRLAATPHRVLQARETRLSIPFFYEPRPALPLDPARIGLPGAAGAEAESYAAFLDREMRRFAEYDRPT